MHVYHFSNVASHIYVLSFCYSFTFLCIYLFFFAVISQLAVSLKGMSYFYILVLYSNYFAFIWVIFEPISKIVAVLKAKKIIWAIADNKLIF